MPTPYRTLGSARVRREYLDGHAAAMARWFDAEGAYLRGEIPSRERLWCALGLLTHGTPEDVALANAIIRATPLENNYFEPIVAAELLLRFRDRLAPAAADNLQMIVREFWWAMLECRNGGGASLHNFTAMTTFYLLAASQLLDGVALQHPVLALIPEVYTRHRLASIGKTALHALAYASEHGHFAHEWNSPTYSPITIHVMARVVELIDDPAAKAIAREIEGKLWREALAFFHPALNLPCGPYARAYRHDMLGHVSQMRTLFCYAGLSRDRSIAGFFRDADHGRQGSWGPDAAYACFGIPWQLSGVYHVPADALEAFRARTYPHRTSGPIAWESFGAVDPATQRWVPVQGTALPGGTAEVVQVQHPTWALGFRTESSMYHSFPIHLHYATAPRVRTLRDVRTVTAAVVFHNAPQEWTPEGHEYPNFNNEGRVSVREEHGGLTFSAGAFPELSPLASTENSLNSFIPIHFSAPDSVTLNGERFTGDAIAFRGRDAVLRVDDRGFSYEIAYRFPRPVVLRLAPWANFLRFSGTWRTGEAACLTPAQLRKCTAEGIVRVVKARD
jgi:hypothetical protein